MYPHSRCFQVVHMSTCNWPYRILIGLHFFHVTDFINMPNLFFTEIFYSSRKLYNFLFTLASLQMQPLFKSLFTMSFPPRLFFFSCQNLVLTFIQIEILWFCHFYVFCSTKTSKPIKIQILLMCTNVCSEYQ